jgi:hypothetical protein
MTQRKIKSPDNPADCVTIAQQVGFSLRRRELYQEIVCAWNAPPSALDDFQARYPIIESMPWTHPEFCEEWARLERSKRAIMRLVPDDEENDYE